MNAESKLKIAVDALRTIQRAHKFNVASMPPHEVHALCFGALEQIGAAVDGPADPEEVKETGAYCSVCGGLQYSTPAGDTCNNGHGGAPGLEAPPKKYQYEGPVEFNFTESMKDTLTRFDDLPEGSKSDHHRRKESK